MKRLFAANLAFLLVLCCIGCSKPAPSDNTITIGNTPNNETDNVTVTNEANLYDENTAMFVCQDRADIEDDHYVVHQYNYKGDLIKSEEIINIGFYGKNGLAPACDQVTGLVGFVDQSGVFVIEPKWDDAAAFSDDGIALVATEDKMYGYINEKGEDVVPCIYDDATSFYPSGLAIVSVSGEYGVIDKEGNTIVEPQYYSIEHIMGDYIVCHSINSDDLYDLNGNKLNTENKDSLPGGCYYSYYASEAGFFRSTMQHRGLTFSYSIKTEIFNGNTFVEYKPASNVSIESKRVTTTSTGYGYGVIKDDTAVIPFKYDEIIQYNNFYIAIKYRNGDESDQVFDIYNEFFEITAEDIEYRFSLHRNYAFGHNMKLPSGYFEVYVYDEENGDRNYGIIDHTGKVIVPPLFYRGVKLNTYEGAGGYFPDVIGR